MNSKKGTREDLKKIPSVDKILKSIPKSYLNIPHKLLVTNIRSTISQLRKDIITCNKVDICEEKVMDKILTNLSEDSFCKLKTVVNGTGIVLHTGLGRAPINKSILLDSIERVYPYTNIELNTNTGKRGERNQIVEKMINSITSSEASIVVNNNAAAVLLMLSAIAYNKEVLVSRGQLVEIGGSFRIPDVIEKSGCNMVEVGTTNKTHLRDYENSINDMTGAVLYAHTSNYKVIGFTKEVDISDLARLSKKKKVPFIADIGSGALTDLKGTSIPYEKMVKDYLKAGVDIVSFSGDKLLGGSQCGIIVGKKKLIQKMHNDPLYRALRCDKITFSILDSVLRTFKDSKNISDKNLTYELLYRSEDELTSIGNKILSLIDGKKIKKYNIKIEDSYVEAGSGSLPTEKISSKCISFNDNEIMKASEIKKNLINYDIPIIGFIKKKIYYIDLKAITIDQIETLSIGINKSLK